MIEVDTFYLNIYGMIILWSAICDALASPLFPHVIFTAIGATLLDVAQVTVNVIRKFCCLPSARTASQEEAEFYLGSLQGCLTPQIQQEFTMEYLGVCLGGGAKGPHL